MKVSSRVPNLLVLGLVASLFLVGCGGGGGGTSSSDALPSTAKVLRWSPPQSFADQTPLDPVRDLKDYAIYVNETGTFVATDSPTAIVSAVDSATGNIVSSFNLGNLGPFLSANKTYYVSMQSVSITGAKSSFSPAASFTL